MARIPEDTINRIKSDISLLRLVESQGFTVSKQGKNYAVRCPFHEEHTPSCIISPKTNLFHCFGCGAAGSVIDWVMKTQGVSFRLAVELLQKDIDAVSSAPAKPVKYATSQKLTSSLAADLLAADEQAALQQVVDYYHQTLLASPEALSYLEKRGLNDPALINEFKLGFANRTLAYHLPQSNRDTGKKSRALLKKIGILRETGHEHFNGSLVVPVENAQGQITEIYGRKLLDNLRKGTPKHLYLPGEHSGVFNEKSLKNQHEVILCESLIDALTLWVHGFKNVTASYGTQGFTEAHLALFKQLNIQRVLIAYDRDDSGENAASLLAAELQAAGLECFRVLFPQGMDANQYACEAENKTAARERLSHALRKSMWEAPESKSKKEEPIKTTAVAPAAQPQIKNEKGNEPAPELPPLPASPIPKALIDDVRCEVNEREVLFDFGGRVYRVRGLNRNSTEGQLKINLMAANDKGYHTDTLELYNAKQRQVFINQAHIELGVKDEVVKKDLGKVLLKLEALQDEQRQEKPDLKQVNALNTEEQSKALALLKTPNLLERIVTDINTTGIVGEDSNVLVGYLACVSRKLDKPLAVMIQSSSAAGKSSLMDSILNLMPEHERIQYSAMTGQSLYYMGNTDLKHKILAIAEEEGASNASYALKLLQSEGEVTIASTGKDENTGDLVTKEYRVEGPVMLLMTTTAIDIDEELMNRCLVLSVNESREQTEAIHAAQRQKRTLAGLKAKHLKQDLLQQHRHAQQLLKPLAVVNPYADQLTFLSDKTRTRRDHEKYLTLIDSIALLHQYQREVKQETIHGQVVEYIEVTLNDIEQANQLAHEVLGRTLDELPPQTRKLLTLIQGWVQENCTQLQIEQKDFRFSRRQVRELSGWGETQVRVHMQRLMDMEYLLTHRGGRGQSFEYELLYQNEASNSERFLMGLLKPDVLNNTMTTTSRGMPGSFAEPSRPQRGGIAVGSRTSETPSQPRTNGASHYVTEQLAEKGSTKAVKKAHVVPAMQS